MKPIGPIVTVVVVVVILIAAIWALVHFVGLQASLIWTALIGAGAWAVRSSIEQKREYQRLLADKKRDQYLQFLDFLNRFVEGAGAAPVQPKDLAASPTQPKVDDIALADLRKWSLRLTLIGSDEVVRAWNAARLASASGQGGAQGVVMLRYWGRLWLAMRRDCGHPDTQLKVTDVLASFVNDIEQHRTLIDED